MSEIYIRTLIKKDNKLVLEGGATIDHQYENFIKELPEGFIVTQYLEATNPNNTLSQLAKVHKCIRTIANYTGNTFLETKKDIKIRSGLLIMSHGVDVEVSFSKISRDDMNLAIQSCIELGDELNINLR